MVFHGAFAEALVENQVTKTITVISGTAVSK